MPTDRMELRQAAEQDIPTLLTVLHAAFEEYRGQLDPPSGVHQETGETLRQKMQAGNAVLARVNNQVVGCVFFELEDDHLYLGRLSVLPQYRQQGVGRALIAYVEDRARVLNIARVQLGVRLALAALREYYERLGYQPIRYAAHEGFAEPTYVMMEKKVLD